MSAPAILAQLNAAGIRISRRGGDLLAEPRAAVTQPFLTLIRTNENELLAALPDAQAISQDAGRTLEPGEHAELMALVNVLADQHAFTQTQRAEARQIARADQLAALECFRDLVAKLPADNRVRCIQCKNLIGGACVRWRELKTARGWKPVPQLLRCEQFSPKPDEADQRTALERWGNLSTMH